MPPGLSPLLVGRDRPLARLREALDRAAAGQRAVVVVAGESGIGKTELIRAATADRPLAAWGTCVEGAGAAGYWAWSRALEQLARQIGTSHARRLAGEEASLLATITPVFGQPSSGQRTARDRLLLFDAVSRWLEAAAAAVPAVVVLDDLHWADDSTVALADFVARSARPAPLCLIVSFRPEELRSAARAHLARFASVAEHIQLGGLDRAAVSVLVASVAGQASPSAVEEIYRRGAGHPVFTRELALLRTDGGATAIPGAVRDLIDRRIRRLPEPAQRVLEVAALAGNDVRPDVLAAVLGTPQPDIDAGCAPARQAGILITSTDGGTRFAHDLYRETLADSIQAARRPALHQAIAAALADRHARGGSVSAAELAQHYCAAIVVDGPLRAARWALAAADADRESLAFTEAAGHLRRWRGAVADAGLTPDDDLRIDVLIAEADAVARAGSLSDARGLLRAARDLAVRGDAPGRQAKVAVAVAHLGAQFSARRDDVIDELDQALSAVADRDQVLEALVSATLARELQHSVADDRPRARPLSEHALALGRAAGDAETLLACLLARHDVLWTPGEGAARAEVAREIVAVAERARDDERRAEGLLLLANALLEEGSGAYLPALQACLSLLDRLGQPRHRYLAETRRAAQALLRADLDEAAERIHTARTLGERIREPDTANVWMSQRLELVRARAQPQELARFAADAVAHWTGAPVHAHAVAAGFLARAGDLDGAERHVATVADLGTWRADRSYLRSVFVRELAVAAIALHQESLCAQLLADLEPLGASCGVNGALVAFAGSHAHTAGLLAAAAGRDGQALLSRARAVYQRLGAAGWLAEIDQGLSSGPGEAATRLLRRQGRTWQITYHGQQATVLHSKGLADLAVLLAKPGQDVHVLELYGSADRSGPAGTLADRTALAAYRQRLHELDDQIAEAAAHHDPERRARLDQEKETLLTELRRVTRPGRQPREFATYPAERARKAVAARLRDTIRRLEHDLPDLAAHLDKTITTGTYCRYRAQPDDTWHIQTSS
jgi:AAA ATPase domain